MNDTFFEKIGKTLTETGKAVTEKTKVVGESAKLNSKIIAKESSARSLYSEIGEYYYNKYKDAPDEEIADAVNELTEALNSIADMKNQLLSIKGAVKCTECGAECPIETAFCGKCGAKLVKPEPPVEEEIQNNTEAVENPENTVFTGEIIEETPSENVDEQ